MLVSVGATEGCSKKKVKGVSHRRLCKKQAAASSQARPTQLLRNMAATQHGHLVWKHEAHEAHEAGGTVTRVTARSSSGTDLCQAWSKEHGDRETPCICPTTHDSD